MTGAGASAGCSQGSPHVPVLLDALIEAVSPVTGTWIDGTFGAGGYTRALLAAGAGRVIAIDRDPAVFDMAAGWAAGYGDRLVMVHAPFAKLDTHADAPVDGVALDLGVSSMQIDQADRGFSFQKDGPLDMRMGQAGPGAADLVNTAPEAQLADILHHYGEERAARRIARKIVQARAQAPVTTTLQLAEIVASVLPRKKPGQAHPATRSFQALRIAVNDELRQLHAGLEAAERVLKPGGKLAVVTFHSLEDRIVKRFMADRSSSGGGGSRHAPEAAARTPAFILTPKKAIAPSEAEIAANPRARSARLRVATRTDAPPAPVDAAGLGLDRLPEAV